VLSLQDGVRRLKITPRRRIIGFRLSRGVMGHIENFGGFLPIRYFYPTPVLSINSSALKYLNIFVFSGILSSHDESTAMGWKHPSLRL
jgi:hypothetical protein